MSARPVLTPGERIERVIRLAYIGAREQTAERDGLETFELAARRLRARVLVSHPDLVGTPDLADAVTWDGLAQILDGLEPVDIAAAAEEINDLEPS